MGEDTNQAGAGTLTREAQEGEPRELRYYLGLLRRRFWVILTVFVVVVTLGVIQAFRATPIYRATARILIEKQGPQVMDFQDAMHLSGSDRGYYKTQEKLASSRAVLEKAVQQPGVREILEHRTGGKGGGGGLLAIVGELRRTVSALVGGKPPAPLEPWQKLRGRLQATQVRDTHLMHVSVDSPSPQHAATLTQAVAEAFEQYHLDRKQKNSSEALSFLQQQAREQESKLRAAEKQLQQFREKVRIVPLDARGRDNPVLARLTRLNEKLTETELARIEVETRVAALPGPAGSEELSLDDQRLFSVPEMRSDPTVSHLKLSLLDAEKEAGALADVYGPGHPQLSAATAKVSLLRRELLNGLREVRDTLAKRLEMLRRQEEELQKEYDEQSQKALALAKQAVTYNRLRNDVERHRKLFDVLVERIREVDLTGDYAKTNVEVVEEAELPRHPIRPNRARRVLLALVLGLALGGALAFFFERLDDSIRTPEDLEEHVGIPVLGSVPTMEDWAGSNGEPSQRGRVTVAEPMSSVAEAYRSIRTSLFFSSPEAETRVVSITSSEVGDGKTTTASNLALAIAQSGKRCLLMGADLRRMMLARVFELPNSRGLSNILVGEAELEQVVQNPRYEGEPIKGLDVVTGGPVPPNPAELLDSEALRRLLARARERYDRIIMDSPPVLYVADASIVAGVADAAILVVKATKNSRSVARRARDHLRDVNARVLGGVLNDVRTSSLGYYYTDYYYHRHPRYAEGYGSLATEEGE